MKRLIICADDFGSVMFEENVVSSAGTTFCMNADAMETRIRAAGFASVNLDLMFALPGQTAENSRTWRISSRMSWTRSRAGPQRHECAARTLTPRSMSTRA